MSDILTLNGDVLINSGSALTIDGIAVDSLSVTQNGTYTASTGHAYSPVTVNVSGGGGGAKKQVSFYDYDGTIVESYTKTEWQSVTALPSNPSHTGLTAQGWNWTKAQIDAQLTAMPDGDVNVGQMYITTSGDTEIDVMFDDPDYLSPNLCVSPNGTVTVDWGDGSSTETMTGTSTTSRTYLTHTYATIGKYTIKLAVDSGTISFGSGASSYGGILQNTDTKSTNKNMSRRYSRYVCGLRLGDDVVIENYCFTNLPRCKFITIPSGVTSIGQYAFSGCRSLSSLTIPSTVTSISQYAFYQCGSLKSLSIPSGITSIMQYTFSECYSLSSFTMPSTVSSIGNSAFNNCDSLGSLSLPSGITSLGNYMISGCKALILSTIPNTVTSIGTYVFQSCYSLSSLTIPSSVTSIGNGAFSTCYSMEEYHFKRTTPPTLGTSAFNSIQSYAKIYVPEESLTAYQTADNWSTYASYMVGE